MKHWTVKNEMAEAMGFAEYEEEIMAALARLDFDVEDTTDVDTLRQALKRELGYEPTSSQMEWFGEGQFDITPRLEDSGIRSVTFERYGYTETRYVITGSPGLFGYEAVQEYLESLL